MRKTLLISIVSSCLTLCMAVSVQAGYMYTKLDVPGASSTYGYAIDGSNIVGWYEDGGGNNHGFNYDISTNTYTTLDVPGAADTYAHSIDGGNIVGWYVAHGGGIYGFLAAIPEPATLSLLSLGGLILLRRRR